MVRDGRVRLLAYSAEGAPEGAPPAPLVKASGLDYDVDIWWGMFAPRGLPADILARLNTEANAALREADMARLYQTEGARPSPMTPDQFTELLRTDIARWRQVGQTANIRLD